MRRPFGNPRGDEVEGQINLTPMLDVVFIMLMAGVYTISLAAN